jgi:Patatin-like phospholipase
MREVAMPEFEKNCFSFSQVLAEEYGALRKNTEWTVDTEQNLLRKMHEGETPLSALCISGGGIRSATFALGVIQAFAEKGILTDFDYLSTVSGGGYIGGWLTAWKHREKGLDKIVPKLYPIAPPPVPGTVDPVQHLREYNSYLTPKLGLLSTDTWTLAATVGRNMMLNWLVLVPILMFGLMIPRLVLAVARLGVTLQSFYGNAVALIANTEVVDAIPVVGGILFAVGMFNAMRYLPGVGNKNHSEFDFIKYCLVPFVGAAVTFIAFDSWYYSNDAGYATPLPPFRDILFWITGSGGAGWIAYLVIGGKTIWRKPQLIVGLTVAILFACFSTAGCAWLLMAKVYQEASWPMYITMAAPLLLVAFMLAITLVVGLTSNILLDEDREWLSRAAAWMLLSIVSWVGLCVVVLLAPAWVIGFPKWSRESLVAVGAAGGWLSAIGGLSSKTKAQKGAAAQQPSTSAFLVDLVAKLAAPVFLIVFFIGLAILTNWVLSASGLVNENWASHEDILENTHVEAVVLLALVFLGFGWVMARYININKFSLNGMYRNRLIRAYLGASDDRHNASKFTGFAESDNLLMRDLDPSLKPFHVVNIALNLVAGRRLAWQQRKAESFTVSPLHAGNGAVGYRSSAGYGGDDGISLGMAITISGAAASPNMGYHSSPVIGFIMTLFNARLGAWLGNPGPNGAKTWRQPGPNSAIGSLLKETFGLTNDTNEYVYLSDGGHFENLATYEMIRRGCRNVVVLDSGCDREFTYEDLGNALRKIRIDLKIPIDFDESLKLLRTKQTRFAVATIRYSALDAKLKDGLLLYVKPIMLGNEPPDVTAYQAANGAFPHQSTSDQWFNESQTESYRMLGVHSVNEICETWDGRQGLSGLLEYLCAAHPTEVSSRASASGAAGLRIL